MKQGGPEHALTDLGFLIGRWETRGTILGDGRKGLIEGTDEYSWVLDSAVMQHTAEVQMDGTATKVLELITYEAEARHYVLRAFDQSGAFSKMTGAFTKNRALRITGEGTRATLTVDPSGDRMKAVWERSADDLTWTLWMELTFTRIAMAMADQRIPRNL